MYIRMYICVYIYVCFMLPIRVLCLSPPPVDSLSQAGREKLMSLCDPTNHPTVQPGEVITRNLKVVLSTGPNGYTPTLQVTAVAFKAHPGLIHAVP